MEWKRKHLAAQRRPLMSNTKVLNENIQALPSYSALHLMANPRLNSFNSDSYGPVTTPNAGAGSFDAFPVSPSSKDQNQSYLSRVSSHFGSMASKNKKFQSVSSLNEAHGLSRGTSLHKAGTYHGGSITEPEDQFIIQMQENLARKKKDVKDEEMTSQEQQEIEKQMKEIYEKHMNANNHENMKEYAEFCNELRIKVFFWLSQAYTAPADLVHIEQNRNNKKKRNKNNNNPNNYNSNSNNNGAYERFELACLLLDNWWARILDATKIVLDMKQDPFITPIILSIFPDILKISLNMRLLGHEPSRVVFDGYLSRYATWWTESSQFVMQGTREELPQNKELHIMREKIEKDPKQHGYKLLTKLSQYVLKTQEIIKQKKHRDRLAMMGFEFDSIALVMGGREFWGQQTVLKISHTGEEKTYQLFLFNDMLLYASGKAGKYKVHRVLFLVFCLLEDLPNGPGSGNSGNSGNNGGNNNGGGSGGNNGTGNLGNDWDLERNDSDNEQNKNNGNSGNGQGGNGNNNGGGGNNALGSQYLKYAFRIHSPQKTVTFALPNAEYKRMVFNKINEGIALQRERVNKLLSEMEFYANKLNSDEMKNDNNGSQNNSSGISKLARGKSIFNRNNNNSSNNKSSKVAAFQDDLLNNINNNGNNKNEYTKQECERCRDKLQLYKNSCAWLHQNIDSVKRGRQNYSEDCKLCLKPLRNIFRTKGKTCPICCDQNVCNDCMQRRSMQGKKKVKVCDGCHIIVEGNLKLPFNLML